MLKGLNKYMRFASKMLCFDGELDLW